MGRGVRVLLLVAALVTAACSSDGRSAGDEATGTAGDEADGEGDVPDGGGGRDDALPSPGELIEAVEHDAGDGRSWTIRYLSTGVQGSLVEVSGMVWAPADADPGAEVVSWAHGTVGVADRCAPSASPGLTPAPVAMLLDAGYVVTVTDYEGLGTEGTHPYLVGTSEGRSVIDIVRAARQLGAGSEGGAGTGADAGLDVGPRYAVAGLSQGGHAALWAGQIAGDYAPELELVGVVAAAPAAGLSDLMRTVGTGAQGFAVMAAYAYAETYDDIMLGDYFTAEAIERMAVVERGCSAEVFAEFLDVGYDRMVQPAAWDGDRPVGPLADRLAENEVATGQAIDAPVLLVQGEVDAIVDRRLVEAVQDRYCAAGTDAAYSLYLGGGHVDTIVTAADDVTGWLADRFAGVDGPDGCATTDPDLEAIRLAEQTEPAVDGTLLDGVTPPGYDDLVDEGTAPPLEACPGTPRFGGLAPVAYSSSVWAVEAVTGPFLDAFVARFASPAEASAAIQAHDRELIGCGTFIDPVTTAEGSFARVDAPAMGDESFATTFSGGLGAIPVSRYGLVVRVGDTLYGASESRGFTGADPDVARAAVEVMLAS